MLQTTRGSDAFFGCPLLPAYQPLRERPVVRSPVTLELSTVQLCSPLKPWIKWWTRAYGSPGIAPSVPGPTIVARPGDTVHVKVRNKLAYPSPRCNETRLAYQRYPGGARQFNMSGNGFCYVNETNIHPHGLHTNPQNGGDWIFTTIPPGGHFDFTWAIPENHMSGTFWYHPHHHHATSAQAGGGAHGAIVIKDLPNALPEEVAEMPDKTLVLSVVDMRFPASETTTGASPPHIAFWALDNLWRDTPFTYVNEDQVFVLVNGMWKPKLEMEEGVWYRLRFVYAAVELVLTMQPVPFLGAHCELQLLAKDGVYLNRAPRDVKRIYLSSGQRSDVAMRCFCPPLTPKGWPCTQALASKAFLGQQGNAWGLRDISGRPVSPDAGPYSGVTELTLEQEVLRLSIKRCSGPVPHRPLRQFRVNRPCYLVDLRKADVPNGQYKDLLWPNPGEPLNESMGAASWAAIWWKNRSQPKSAYTGMPMKREHQQGYLFDLPPAEVNEFFLRGPARGDGLSYHSFHLHTTPYQIVWLDQDDKDADNYFRVGDWQDTFMHSAGWARVRFQTSTWRGRYIIHCHILAHEDMGMMAYFDVHGKQGKTWPGARELDPSCYEDKRGAGFTWVKG